MIARRPFLGGALALAAGWAGYPGMGRADTDRFTDALARLEAGTPGARLGVCLLDTATGAVAGRRLDERFPMCSTFKFLLAAAVLARADAGAERLDDGVAITKADLIAWSPVSKRAMGTGLTVAELCGAAVTHSDNAAANLLLARIGGPKGFTAYVRTLGDTATRLDRIEPAMNEAIPGDPRDTTTPRAMAQDIRTLVLGDALSPASRERLTGWLVGNTTGDTRLRAGFPGGWRVGDKTGTGPKGTNNDIGIAWPPGRAPIIVSSYLTGAKVSRTEQDAVHGVVARLAAAAVGA